MLWFNFMGFNFFWVLYPVETFITLSAAAIIIGIVAVSLMIREEACETRNQGVL